MPLEERGMPARSITAHISPPGKAETFNDAKPASNPRKAHAKDVVYVKYFEIYVGRVRYETCCLDISYEKLKEGSVFNS